jgi:hypothetical protein
VECEVVIGIYIGHGSFLVSCTFSERQRVAIVFGGIFIQYNRYIIYSTSPYVTLSEHRS